MEELPQLESRYGHACAALPATGVRLAQPNSTHVKPLQALVVVGGTADGSNYLSSVLTLLPEAKVWTHLASLPRTFGYAHASIVGGKMRLTGGYDGSSRRSEVVTNHYSDAM